jgi:hypothetical protein
MGTGKRERVAHLLYAPVLVAVLAVVALRFRPAGEVHLAMVLFALAVFLVDWVETRRLFAHISRHDRLVAVALTLPVLGIWTVIPLLAPDRLPLYFALLAGLFFLRAVRDATVRELTPVELLVRGYANFVAIYLVLGAAAETVDRFQLALLLIAGFVYAVRLSFRWTGVVFSRLG